MSKKKKNGDPDPVDLGPVMTVSLFLILLTFFIMLNSIAVIDERRVRASLGSILGAFGSFTGGYAPSKTGEDVTPPTAPMKASDVDFDKVLTLDDKTVAEQIKVEPLADKERVTINADFLFQGDGLSLKPSCHLFLNRLAALIQTGTYTVEILGHTGMGPPIENGGISNWAYSSRMAMAVYDYFVQSAHIDPERLEMAGAGAFRPIASNDTPLSRAENRRVDVILYANVPQVEQRIFKKRPSNIFTFDTFDFRIFD